MTVNALFKRKPRVSRRKLFRRQWRTRISTFFTRISAKTRIANRRVGNDRNIIFRKVYGLYLVIDNFVIINIAVYVFCFNYYCHNHERSCVSMTILPSAPIYIYNPHRLQSLSNAAHTFDCSKNGYFIVVDDIIVSAFAVIANSYFVT